MDSQWLLSGSGIFLGAAGWFQALFLLNIFIVLASIMSCVQECFFPHFCFAEDKYLRLPNAFCDFAVSDSSMFLSNVFIAYRKKKSLCRILFRMWLKFSCSLGRGKSQTTSSGVVLVATESRRGWRGKCQICSQKNQRKDTGKLREMIVQLMLIVLILKSLFISLS